ncbi:MAG: serine hydrolase domain-containing protein [Paracoccaceae bacterium]
MRTHPNPDLSVGADNKQGWNQPANRRAGFHNAHLLFRRALMVRARQVLSLTPAPDPAIAARVADSGLTARADFSALVVAEGDRLLFAAHAADFGIERPHSIQSVTKIHINLIAGRLVEAGLLDLSAGVERYLPWIGTAYRGASLGDLLDMNVANDFSEDYSDPAADCYREEEALGWRLPKDGATELTLKDFVAGLTGADLSNRTGYCLYKSANTDVLTLILAGLVDLQAELTAIADAAGYAGAFHISLSPDGLPAFSGGGCLSATDLARLGLLFVRQGRGVAQTGDRQTTVGSAAFIAQSLTRPAPTISPQRDWQRYSRHLMTDGRFIGHAGYGGQYLMADMQTGRVAAFLSVLENKSGYDEAYMRHVIRSLEAILKP